MDWIHNLLAQFASLDEGVRNLTYAALGGVFVGLWGRLRRKQPERAVVSVNAPPGEYVKVEVGQGETRR